MSLRPADSWYEATARRDAPLPALEGDIDADVCVVGAGLSGCSTAMHLAQRGYKVVVLEAERIGYGASGRSGGQIIPGWAGGMDKIAAQLGKADAKRIWDFSLEGVDMTRELIEQNRIDCDLAWGHMHVALKPRQRQELLDMQREQEGDFGYRKLRFMEREETESWIASKRYIAGLHDAGAGHLHPLRYTIGVGKAAIAAGARIFEKSEVTGIQYGPTVTVKTAKGSVRAKFLALCANVGHVDLSERLARKLIGVASYIVATKPLGAERAAALLKDNIAVADLNWIIDYYRLSADYRLLFGGRVSYSGARPARHCARDAASHAERLPAARGRRDRLRLGRDDRHHDEPPAQFRAARAQRVLPAGLLRPRHGRDHDRRQDRRRGDRRARPSASTSSRGSSTTTSRAASFSAARRSSWR